VELEEEQQKDATESTDSKVSYDTEVKFTNDGLKLANLDLAVGAEDTQDKDIDEGDAVPPPAKKDEKKRSRKTLRTST
jgi:hypothetical protein